VLEDLGTPDGTFVAGRRIRQPVSLSGSEELCFGYTYAVLEPVGPARRRKRSHVPRAVGVAAVLGLVLIGTLVGVLLPRTGGEGPEALVAPPVQLELARDGGPTERAPSPPPAERQLAPVTETEATNVEDGPVVLREDFSDVGSGWELVDGEAARGAYADGEYAIDIRQLGYYVTVDSDIEADHPVVSVEVRNPGRSPSAGFGILCRYQSEQDFVALAAGTDGTAAILRRRDGALSVISGGGEWVASPNVPVNADSYRLRADCRGRHVELFVDGRSAVSARSTASAGTVGLFAAGRVEIRFDDVTIVDHPG
jgi:hypothetical protein